MTAYQREWLLLPLGTAIGVLGVYASSVGAAPIQFNAGETLTASKLNGNFDELHQRLMALEGLAECPAGYTLQAGAPNPSNPQSKLCVAGDDEIVKVGTGAATFWIDRFEASVWNDQVAPTQQYGASTTDDYPGTFPDTGEATSELYALSISGVIPSRRLTWFQAQQACAASGKRLPSVAEWLLASTRTVDPGSSDGSGGSCATSGGSVRNTGLGASCRSWYGSEDMIGNVWEMTDQWVVGLPQAVPVPPTLSSSWPTTGLAGSFASDTVASWGYGWDRFRNDYVHGLPGVVSLGGSGAQGTGAGRFALVADNAPTMVDARWGFRCVVPR